jgi:hypothetical protein
MQQEAAVSYMQVLCFQGPRITRKICQDDSSSELEEYGVHDTTKKQRNKKEMSEEGKGERKSEENREADN